MSDGVVSKKLKFKGDKPKRKKRSSAHGSKHHDAHDDLEALAAADPSGWMFPQDVGEITGPTFVLLPTDPLTCLAWDPTRERVYAAPVDAPQAPEGAPELSASEVLNIIEPSDVNHVWVIARLAGSEDISLRSSNGTFLTASPSGTLTATAASRGPLEGFSPEFSTADSLFPTLSLKTYSGTYLSMPKTDLETITSKKAELRADADSPGELEGLRIKCQREHVLKARVAALEGKAAGASSHRLLNRGQAEQGSYEDELKKNTEYQAWGAGKHHVSSSDRRDLKKARKEGRLAEAMLDRRAAMKSDRYAK